MGMLTPERYLRSLRKTPVILNALISGISQEQAQQLTDGPGGWSIVETMCHIRDFNDVSLSRAQVVLTEDQPQVANLAPLERAQKRDYANQNLAAEFTAYLAARKTLIALLSDVSGAQWQRQGIHASFGSFTLLDLLIFIEYHDVDHIEQIARTLNLSEALL